MHFSIGPTSVITGGSCTLHGNCTFVWFGALSSQNAGIQFLLCTNLVITTRLLWQEYIDDPPPEDGVHILDGMLVSEIGHPSLRIEFDHV